MSAAQVTRVVIGPAPDEMMFCAAAIRILQIT